MLSQIEGGADVVDAAIRHSWEAGAVVVIMLVMLGGITWMMKLIWGINQRLADRVTALENQLTQKLISIVSETVQAVSANTQMLDRTAQAIDKLETAVETSLRTQQAILARIETSPCLMTTVLSKETTERIAMARKAAADKSSDTQ